MAPSLSGIVASEDGIVEKPALALLQELGWTHVDLRDEVPGPGNPTGRTSYRQVMRRPDVRRWLEEKGLTIATREVRRIAA